MVFFSSLIGLIGLLYCGLVALASLLILVRIYVLFVDARESEKNAICWENSEFSSTTPIKRVEAMFKQILEVTRSRLGIILCVLPKEKVYDVSGTPPQHLVGVSKPNRKLTSVLKRHISILNHLN